MYRHGVSWPLLTAILYDNSDACYDRGGTLPPFLPLNDGASSPKNRRNVIVFGNFFFWCTYSLGMSYEFVRRVALSVCSKSVFGRGMMYSGHEVKRSIKNKNGAPPPYSLLIVTCIHGEREIWMPNVAAYTPRSGLSGAAFRRPIFLLRHSMFAISPYA